MFELAYSLTQIDISFLIALAAHRALTGQDALNTI
jgi:hypothetical protein